VAILVKITQVVSILNCALTAASGANEPHKQQGAVSSVPPSGSLGSHPHPQWGHL